MPKSTVIFAVLAVCFLMITSWVLWEFFRPRSLSLEPQVEGATVQLSLPDLRPDNSSKRFTARSVLLWDSDTHVIRFEQNGFERLPIASITKLMTAMVALDHGIPWDDLSDIQPNEYVQGGRLLLHAEEQVTMRNLFTASLLGSANNATLAYVRHLGIDQEQFIQEMNRKAVELGLEQTHFTDVTGLEKTNVSTAYEVARLAEHAFTRYPDIAHATQQIAYTFTVAGSGREHTMRNTNKLISEYGQSYLGSKTGYLDEAQYCLVVRGAALGSSLIGVILASPSEPEHFADMSKLMRSLTQ